MKSKPEIVNKETKHEGFMTITKETMKVPGLNKPYHHETVKIQGHAVAVIPFLDDETVLIVEQYRHSVGKNMMELIQGGVEEGEDPKEAGKREMLEETGYTGELEYLFSMHMIAAFVDQEMFVYKAKNIKKVTEPLDDPLEEMEVHKIPFKELIKDIHKDAHFDSALIAAALFLDSKKNKN